MKQLILGITGASGSLFGLRLLRELVKSSHVFITVSSGALSIIKDEAGLDLQGNAPEETLKNYAESDAITVYQDTNLNAPIASGSFRTDGMFIVPCSMKTLSSVANGMANNLIERSADVTIKEGRRLVLSPREMPLSAIHLENMLKLSRLGVTIAPPVPAFYHKPQSMDDIIAFVVGKLLDSMGIPNNLYSRWEGN
ncbi:MAG: UbiX family flavin prenyltransferase [bacterium]